MNHGTAQVSDFAWARDAPPVQSCKLRPHSLGSGSGSLFAAWRFPPGRLTFHAEVRNFVLKPSRRAQTRRSDAASRTVHGQSFLSASFRLNCALLPPRFSLGSKFEMN